MKKMKCIIVDDEPVARKIIREFVGQVAGLELAGEFEHAVKAGDFLHQNQIGLVFLDIEMPRISGIEWLKSLSVKPMVILTTAFPEYALEGYELDIIDYLLKPVSFPRFIKAVDKAREYAEMKNRSMTNQHTGWLFVRTDKRIEKVVLEDILYIESVGNYVNIVTDEKKLLAYLTLKGIEGQLPDSRFIKIHQSYLINFSRVEAIEGNQVGIKNKFLPIGRSYKETVMQIIDERLLRR